ncbi:uncharacterized protein LMH87_008122 [Akanthomyces muscarius]|uniref:Zn(2)-C6 fungal-type domain-containing protein n=1 Tax=Akanthomyces muscarius TaxID=2231603 RepID=A0A9W8QJ14_AKAMU|nr:uncharacterized protein LMH87_008122 [Akanthomyces muscarius]KAJ4159214.1 hypothetical protein LMH87_008122 [Akanthomyces muscarius]
MPAIKYPCVQCKEKHVKCDEEKPKCKRCQQKDLPCSRPTKKTIFRHGATARFDKDQKWVNSSARQFRVQTTGDTPPSNEDAESPPIPRKTADLGTAADATSSHSSSYSTPVETPHSASDQLQATNPRRTDTPMTHRPSIPSISYLNSALSPPVGLPGIASLTAQPVQDHQDGTDLRQFPLQDVQEACLLRYFIDEISQWFDLCDENRHFQLVVPLKARKHTHLLNAIFAVSARHLSRLPQYKTPQGILYQGQLLTKLGNHDAVEYMLKCIPAFRRFHENEDDDFRESIIATAVILRQLEEIDEEDEDPDDDYHMTGEDEYLHEKQINFMPIINAVLRDPASQAMFGHRSLIQAAYWFALRQEIYHSFTRRKPPQLDLPLEYWQGASNVNKTVMHTVQVAKWHWGRGTDDEFLRLMDQQSFLEHTVLANTRPLLQKPADKRQGEIFPTIWYTTHIELTSIQQSLMARSVLVSENPYLKQQASSRASWRKVENEVRLLMLDLCGIALCHPASAPALVNAAIGIQLYGDYFTDQYERLALRSVVEKYRDAHAWPVRRLLEMFT